MTRRAVAVVVPLAALAAACGDAPVPQAETQTPAVAASAAAAPAPQPISDPAEAQRLARDRHERFEEIGKAFKAINDQLKTGSPDLARIAERAALIDRYAPHIATWFPAGTGPQDGVRTDALATVWSEPDRFSQAAAAMVEASARFAAAAQGNDPAAVRAAAGPLGQACKTCHDRFREEHD